MTHTEETKRSIRQAAIDREHKKIMAKIYICHKCGKTTDSVRANDHLCMKCVEEWYNNKTNDTKITKMNEAKWQCPHCSRYHVDSVDSDKHFEPTDILRCQYCGLHTIVEEITYILHGRKQE